MSLLTSLLILIVCARLMGHLFEKYNQPSIIGEMLAGIILGPSLLNLIHFNEALSGISELAVFLVVLSAGLEMNFKDITDVLKGRGLIIALLGFIIPLASGIAIGVGFGLDASTTVFLGLCVSITALPVAAKILESFNLLKTDIARYSIATAIVNDVLALLALGVILDIPNESSILSLSISIAITSGKLIVLAAFILGFNWLLEIAKKKDFPFFKIPEKLASIFGNEALFGLLVLFVLVFGSVSEALGFHFVIGAFFGALLISKEFFIASRFKEIEHTLNSITNGFLGPVFFAAIGLELSVQEISSGVFVIIVLVVSVASKIIAGWVGGRLIGLSNTNSLGIGIILNGRGVVEFVIASIAFQRGFISKGLFSSLIVMGVITTLITPILFKKYVLPKLTPQEGAS